MVKFTCIIEVYLVGQDAFPVDEEEIRRAVKKVTDNYPEVASIRVKPVTSEIVNFGPPET